MSRRRKINIGIVILFAALVRWQYGLFNRYNYLTAKFAIMRGAPTIITVGEPTPCDEPCMELREKYGFQVKNFGKKVSGSQLRGINDYNLEIKNYLIRKNGADWLEKYESELGTLNLNTKSKSNENLN